MSRARAGMAPTFSEHRMPRPIRATTRTPSFRWMTYGDKRFRVTPDNYATAVITIDLSEAIDSDLEQFLDLISDRAFGSTVVMDPSYTVLGVTKQEEIRLRVTGDVSLLLDELAGADAVPVAVA